MCRPLFAMPFRADGTRSVPATQQRLAQIAGQLHPLVQSVARLIPFDQRELGIVQRAEFVEAKDAGDLIDRPAPAASSRFMANSGDVCSHRRCGDLADLATGDAGHDALAADHWPSARKTDRDADRRPYRPRGSAFRLRESRVRRRTPAAGGAIAARSRRFSQLGRGAKVVGGA